MLPQNASYPSRRGRPQIDPQKKARETLLQPSYKQIALLYADLHE